MANIVEESVASAVPEMSREPGAASLDFFVRAALKICGVPQAFAALQRAGQISLHALPHALPAMPLPGACANDDLGLAGALQIVRDDMQGDALTVHHPFATSGFRLYAAAAIPGPDGLPQGVLGVLDRRVGRLGPEQLDWLLELAEQAAVQLDRARLGESVPVPVTGDAKDALTGLPKREWLLSRLEDECYRAKRFAQPLSLVVFDLDQLGEMNTQLGTDHGDAAIARVGRLLRQALRRTDTGGRLAGDRFAIVLPNTTAEGAATLAEVLRGRIESRPNPLEPALAMSASFGVSATSADATNSTDKLLQAATRALDEARAAGRNRVVVSLGAR